MVSISSQNVWHLRALTLQRLCRRTVQYFPLKKTIFQNYLEMEWSHTPAGVSIVTFSRPKQTFNIHTIIKISVQLSGSIFCWRQPTIYSAIGKISTGKWDMSTLKQVLQNLKNRRNSFSLLSKGPSNVKYNVDLLISKCFVSWGWG